MIRLLLVASLLVACARSTPAPSAGERLPLPGAVVLAKPDPVTELTAYDPDTLFHLAGEARRNDDPKKAATLYLRLIDEFPTSELVLAARFNLALAYEDQKAWEQAAAVYREITALEAPGDRRTWLDAHYRLAVVESQRGAYWEAVAAFDAVLAQSELDEFDKLEAMVGRGITLRSAGEPEAADVALSQALRFHTEANAKSRMEDRGLVAEAAFHLGEIARDRFEKIELAYPIEILRTRLEEKCEQLLSAQYRYLRAIRHGDAHTVAAAGFRIGALYETLYDAMVHLETPAELDPEQAEVYRDEVKSRVGILVKKAIMVYEKSLAVGRSAPSAEAWTSKIEAALERLKQLYLAGDALPPPT